MKFLIINGPNLNLLGQREPGIYGPENYESLCARLKSYAAAHASTAECFQSNHEGAIVDAIQGAYRRIDGIIINPAAYTHTSIAILDALKAVGMPAGEVHLSDVDSREDFRQISYAGKACCARFAGMGFDGYLAAAKHLVSVLS